MLKGYKFKLTTECGYKWRWEQNYYWKDFRFRPLIHNDYHIGGTTNERVGIALGPVMFFWKWK